MSMTVRDEASDLIKSAFTVYADDPAAVRVIDDLDRRLKEPLRLALAGMVKAGKSTLLNAMLGEQIAPTDAGECTRVVTWYRYSDDAVRHAASASMGSRGACPSSARTANWC